MIYNVTGNDPLLSQWRVSLHCRRPGFDPWAWKIPWRRKWQSTPVFLPGKSHGQRGLAGYSLWGCRVGHDLATKPPTNTTESVIHVYTSNPFLRFYSYIGITEYWVEFPVLYSRSLLAFYSYMCCECHAKLFQSCPTLWDPMNVACQAPLSMGFSRQEYWSGLPCPPSGALPGPGIKPRLLRSPAQAGSLPLVPPAAAAESLQSCPTLCDPIDGSPLGSSAPGILQARTLKWVAVSFSNAWKWKGKGKSLSRVRLLATPRTEDPRLPHPWDFPGKSTGVGCHCLLRVPPRKPLFIYSSVYMSTPVSPFISPSFPLGNH